jgi:hypothetical protein
MKRDCLDWWMVATLARSSFQQAQTMRQAISRRLAMSTFFMMFFVRGTVAKARKLAMALAAR